MLYLYDPNNWNCDCFKYARNRAAIFFRYQRKRYCGEVDDLEQVAMQAVVEAVAGLENQREIPEEVIHLAVDKALAAETKTKVRSDTNIDYDNLVNQLTACHTAESEAKLAEFRRILACFLDKEHLNVLWDYYVVGKSLEDMVADVKATQVGKGKWEVVKPEKFRRILEEALAIARAKISDKHVDPIATLPIADYTSE